VYLPVYTIPSLSILVRLQGFIFGNPRVRQTTSFRLYIAGPSNNLLGLLFLSDKYRITRIVKSFLLEMYGSPKTDGMASALRKGLSGIKGVKGAESRPEDEHLRVGMYRTRGSDIHFAVFSKTVADAEKTYSISQVTLDGPSDGNAQLWLSRRRPFLVDRRSRELFSVDGHRLWCFNIRGGLMRFAD
jgi:hypothetical protein